MLLLQNLLTALEQVWANKLRSVLTVLGVIIAVTSTIVVVAVVQGFLGGLVMAGGCFAGGWLCQRARPRVAYALAGLALGLAAHPGDAKAEKYKVFLSMSYIGNDWQAEAANMGKAMAASKEFAAKVIAPVDPLTCAGNLRDRQVLIIAGKRDDIVPPKATVALWEASGKQKIVWYNCTHYGAALYMVPAMAHIVKHFGAE